MLEALIGIDEVNFCFEIQFLLVVAWKDERINTKCTGAGSYGQVTASSDRCAHYWRPALPPVFANQVSIDGNAPIEVIEDLGCLPFPAGSVQTAPPWNHVNHRSTPRLRFT